MAWLGFLSLYIGIGLIVTIFMTPCDYIYEEDDYEYDARVFLIMWLLWAPFLAYYILKLIFYHMPKSVVYTLKYLKNN